MHFRTSDTFVGADTSIIDPTLGVAVVGDSHWGSCWRRRLGSQLFLQVDSRSCLQGDPVHNF